ncbi:hypothetical protein OB905_07555 [Halobacteria archaeon AArc-dxtr1]|nr:hypothetical protein [Halobacteria archaeon AArc-dxtr1]
MSTHHHTASHRELVSRTTESPELVDRSAGGSRTDPFLPLATNIERTRHQLRIAFLERELAASRMNRQAIINQYELVLEERACDCNRPHST